MVVKADFKKLRLLVSVMALASTATLSGCWHAQTADDLVKEAQADHAKGDDAAAVIQLKNALQKEPENGHARYVLGVIYKSMGNLPAAEDELHRAFVAGVKKDDIRADLAQIYLDRGEYQKIIDEIKVESGMKPLIQATILVLRGDAYLGLGQKSKADDAYAQAEAADPTYLGASLGHARVLAAKNEIDESLSLIEGVIQKNPKNSDALVMKGDLLRVKGDTDGALQAYKQAVSIDPGSARAHVALASLYIILGKSHEAQEEVTATEKAAPNSMMGKYLQAALDFHDQKFQAARESIAQVLKTSADHIPSVLLSGAIEYQLGAYENALSQFGKVVSAYPNNLYAVKMMATIQLKLKQPVAALRTLSAMLLEVNPDPQVLGLAAESYMQTGEYDKASKLFEKIAAKEPDNAATRMRLGLSRLAGGQTTRAMADLEAAEKLDPTHPDAENVLALTYLGKQNFAQALVYAQKMIKKDPKNPAFRDVEGVAYVGKGDIPNARKSFEAALGIDKAYVPGAINLALLDIKENKLAEAKKDFEAVLTIDKNNLQAMNYLALMAKNAGDEKGFVDWLDKAAKGNPTALQPRSILTRYYLQKGDKQNAVAEAQAAVTGDPTSLMALDMLGATQMSVGQNQDALATFKKLTQMAPRAPLAYLRLAGAQEANKDVSGAIESLNHVLEIQPGYIDALNMLVTLQIKSGHFPEALKLAKDFEVRFPKNVVGFMLEGDVYMAQKQYPSALAAFQRAQSVQPTTVAAIGTYDALTESGKAKQAEASLVSWLKAHPGDLVARNYMASAYLKNGNNAAAEGQYREIVKLSPDNSLAMNNLAWLYQAGKDPRALDTARAAYKLSPGNPDIEDTLGWILVNHGEAKEGLGLIEKAAIANSKSADVQYHFGVALAKNGDKDRAKKVLQTLLNSDEGKSFPQVSEAKLLLEKL
jgi:putative PEP-CTERM system TPR-repeat lipoprotein